MKLGDSHNFGQYVKLIGEKEPFILKPRTILWEKCFFGTKSVFAGPLANTNMSFLLFLTHDEHDGFPVTALVKPETISNRNKAVKNFGVLLGYCLAFGIQDIQHENVIEQKCGFLPIDIEVVFTNIFWPSHTGLVPGNHVGYPRSVLRLLEDRLGLLSPADWIDVLEGFVQTVQTLENMKLILEHHFLMLKDYKKTPVRIIIRDTRDYRTIDINEMSEAEITQLARNDIPYFFTTLKDSPSVKYYTDSFGSVGTVLNQSEGLQKKSALLDIQKLLSEERLGKLLIPSMFAYSLKHTPMKPEHFNMLKTNYFECKVHDQELEVRTEKTIFKLRLT